jgi:hypothetical protein
MDATLKEALREHPRETLPFSLVFEGISEIRRLIVGRSRAGVEIR